MDKNTVIKIPQHARIKVYWDDTPENYSKENKITVRNYFSTKYGVEKSNIDVIYRPVKLDSFGEMVEISGAGIENIMDVGYQRELFKEWLTRESKTVDYDRLISLDDKINSELNIEVNDTAHKSWSLSWMMINGFLCFGANNFVSLSKLKGLTIINSYPENQGGKTTFSVDSFKFLLYGKTSKTDKNEAIFNQYWDNDELIVRGMIILENKEIIIERIMTRKKKRSGEWNVTNSLKFYEVMPDGEEREMTDEDSKATTNEISKAIGSENDFELVTLATANNLDDLIGLTTTESGKLLTRFIGLEVIEHKSEVARSMYNNFAKTKKSNHYDIITLGNEIDGYDDNREETIVRVLGHRENIIKLNNDIIVEEGNLKDLVTVISDLNNDKDSLLSSKKQIDVEILTLNPSNLNVEITNITAKGKDLKVKFDGYINEIKPLLDVKFDEDYWVDLTYQLSTKVSEKAVNGAEIERLNKVVLDLIAGGTCQACERALDDVDNTQHIKTHNGTIDLLMGKLLVIDGEINSINEKMSLIQKDKVSVETRQKLELDRDRVDIELSTLRLKLKSKKDDLEKYNSNIEGIEFNKNKDIEIDLIKTKLAVADNSKTKLTQLIERLRLEVIQNETDITTKEKLIEQIKKEDEIEKIFKVYIDMVGKKGISKLVLRSVLPIINSEVQRLLDGVVDFDVEVSINDKNDVQFIIIKDEVEKQLKSGSGLEMTVASIALRCVLGKISTLPMPNFITFDEVLGKVARVNIPLMKPLFDKITDMYDVVFFITHDEEVKDWGDNIITIKKENNISSIYIK